MDKAPLTRVGLDVARVVQLGLAAIAVYFPTVADIGDEAQEAITAGEGAISAGILLVVAVLEVLGKRRSVTPVVDPRTNDGLPLTPPGQ